MKREAATHEEASWFQATARQRVDGLLDHGSFREYLVRPSGFRARISGCSICPPRSTTAS